MKGLAGVAPFLVLAAALGGCYHGGNRENDVVVESENLVPTSSGCVVRGTVRNEGHHTLRVFISWEARDRDDDKIGEADVEIRDFPGGTTRGYESTRFRDFDGDRPRCDQIRRIEREKSAFHD
jgi:hypothetical protein